MKKMIEEGMTKKQCPILLYFISFLFISSMSGIPQKAMSQENNTSLYSEIWISYNTMDPLFESIKDAEPRSGVKYRFYDNGSFKIYLWWTHGVSIGGLVDTFITGTYTYDPLSLKIILTSFEEEPQEKISNPVSGYVMNGLKNRGLPRMEKGKILSYTNCTLQIVKESEDSQILVDLYAINEMGNIESFGQTSFFRVDIESYKKGGDNFNEWW